MNQSCIRLYRISNVGRKLLCTCTIFSTNIKSISDSFVMDRLKFNYLFRRFRSFNETIDLKTMI